MLLSSENEKLVEYNGKITKIGGKTHKIRVYTIHAIYPYDHYEIFMYADMCNKYDPEYVEIKNKLGDDYSTDLLESESEIYAEAITNIKA